MGAPMTRLCSSQMIEIRRIGLMAAAFVCLISTSLISPVRAQDIPGIENCTVEKAMDRRTSCLQSNVNYLKAEITQLQTVSLGQLEAAKRQIDALKASLITMQATVAELKAAADKKTPEAAKTDTSKPDASKSETPADTTKK